jgi:hypothetical protein
LSVRVVIEAEVEQELTFGRVEDLCREWREPFG